MAENYSDKVLHVRNLEKYHPGYKDRTLTWAKIKFSMVQGDPECEMLDEIDWGRFVKFILLELEAQRPIPLNDDYLLRKGINTKNRPIYKTINMLQEFIVIDTVENLFSCLEREKEEEKDKEEEKEEEKMVVRNKDTSQTIFMKWNVFASENNLSKVISLSTTRKKKITARLKEDQFDFEKILEEIKKSNFLLGKAKDWKVDFDFVINSEGNYLKILEGKYRNNNEKNRAENNRRNGTYQSSLYTGSGENSDEEFTRIRAGDEESNN